MYGIVNKAIEGLICDQYGKAMWEKIANNSSFELDGFLSNESYPDQITYKLIEQISKETGIHGERILFDLGEYWIMNTGMKSYGTLMKAGGKNLREFLLNLPNFHSRGMLMYPKITPPEFESEEIDERSILLHYYSNREGLSSFVEGLIIGLSKMFETEIEIISVPVINHRKASYKIIIK